MLKKYGLVLFLSCISFFTHAEESVIILLNGPSSVGKTSIQKALQKESNTTYLQIGIDTFFDALLEQPDLSSFAIDKKFDQFTAKGDYIRGVSLTQDSEGHPIVPLHIGPAGDKVMFGMHRAMASYALAGNSLIIDYILYKPAYIKDLAISLKDCKVYLIKVTAPLHIIEERERLRNTSPIGHARSHYDTVHKGMLYDAEVDTFMSSPVECAKQILEFIAKEKNPKALKQLAKT